MTSSSVEITRMLRYWIDCLQGFMLNPNLRRRSAKPWRIAADLFDKVLEKLWIHKGAVLDFAENVSRGDGLWRSSYILQGDQKRTQIDQMIRFAESTQCRMMSLVRHFGDTSDSAMA
jgi:DNA topoisomerase III